MDDLLPQNKVNVLLFLQQLDINQLNQMSDKYFKKYFVITHYLSSVQKDL
jgi:hypothetical protein